MTSDERREVARRLRDEADGFRRHEKEWGQELTIDLGDVPAIFQDVTCFAGLDGTVRDCVLLDRLADLIDPKCSMDAIDTGEIADYDCCEHIMHCKSCDAEFGYVLYSEDGDVDMDDKPKFCPECGARVVSDDD